MTDPIVAALDDTVERLRAVVEAARNARVDRCRVHTHGRTCITMMAAGQWGELCRSCALVAALEAIHE